MLRRTHFKKPERPPKVSALLRPLEKPVNVARISANDPAPGVAKENPLRSEAYRRLVAALPCAHCRKVGRSQHAHENDGKAKGMKLDDRCAMPLCADEPGLEGCHTKFDRYELIQGGRPAHVELGRRYARHTRASIIIAGTWPKNLPLWSES